MPAGMAPAWPGSSDGFGVHDGVMLRTSRPSYRVGEPIDVSWSGGPGYRWDWIAVFSAPTATLRDAHLLWRHTGTRSEGALRLDGEAAIVDQSSVGGVWPLPPGEYVAAYLLDDAPVAFGHVTDAAKLELGLLPAQSALFLRRGWELFSPQPEYSVIEFRERP